MKNLLRLLPIMAVTVIFFTCTTDSDVQNLNVENQVVTDDDTCFDEDPITRVVNNGTVSFDFKVLDASGTVLVEIPNIPPNTSTSWASFSQGEILFSITNNNSSSQDDKIEIQMTTCMAYELEIDVNNEVVSYSPIIL